jgi:hypothetical protein
MQPIDFLGDVPRIPLMIVSPFTRGGHVSHTYGDHASIVKFIERNWHLKPLTSRSRDNLKNQVVDLSNPYLPLNAPAVDDLFDMFHFDKDGGDSPWRRVAGARHLLEVACGRPILCSPSAFRRREKQEIVDGLRNESRSRMSTLEVSILLASVGRRK